MLHLLDQPGGDQGGVVAQVDHAGGALGPLLPHLQPDLVPARSANIVFFYNVEWTRFSTLLGRVLS